MTDTSTVLTLERPTVNVPEPHLPESLPGLLASLPPAAAVNAVTLAGLGFTLTASDLNGGDIPGTWTLLAGIRGRVRVDLRYFAPEGRPARFVDGAIHTPGVNGETVEIRSETVTKLIDVVITWQVELLHEVQADVQVTPCPSAATHQPHFRTLMGEPDPNRWCPGRPCDHSRSCCGTHQVHTSPHRGCILR